MKAEIITIGDELLLGQVIDTNSAWLGQELNRIGARVHHKSTISDSREAILIALREASHRSDVILITGGLGPTKDDITKVTLCDFFDTKLVLNQKVLDWVQSIFNNRNLPMLESNNQQAMVPENCEVLWNKNGTAPGMWFYENGKAFISMPGVPFEMKTIFIEEAIPKLKHHFSFPSILHRTIQTIGIGESFLAKKIAHIEDELPDHIKLAYLPAVGSVRLRFSAYGQNIQALEEELNPIIANLYSEIGQHIFGEGEDSISEIVGNLLRKKNATLSTAESCTGGFIAHQLTSIPGSSDYFIGSVISYDNRIKINELGVGKNIIEKEGAVSEACVMAMAAGIRLKYNTTYAIATSGIAGPGGGTEAKPVGTVWISIATPDNVFARVYHMGDNRERTIQRTALTALEMLRKELLN
ncbi:MAG: competence/damage-inducible protein A [Bacteroidetes bacterium B1(2017)]|nr:MAG: competence/damage-inducible protein A [Bacteroidetes bacterium B1(2017)]